MPDEAKIRDAVMVLRGWLQNEVLVLHTLVELLVVAVAFAVAWLIAPRISQALLSMVSRVTEPRRDRARRVVRGVVFPFVWLLLLAVALLVTDAANLPEELIVVTANLLGAWVFIRAASVMIREPVWARSFAWFVWSVAALNILGLLPQVLAAMDGVVLTLGDLKLSVLTVVKSLLLLVVLLWAANLLSAMIARRIGALPSLSPSMQVLTRNVAKFLFITVAVVAALSTLGIDLTAFAVFSGAVGVGLGFGLQKIVSNLISGVIILLDRSVKPGDVIAVSGTYGWINTLGARYVSVITRDGVEHLIPNEEFITQRVENWSHSHNLIRLRAPISVSYRSDLDRVLVLCKEAARDTPRVLAQPAPVCLVTNFGDNGIELELRFWINDPVDGVGNVRSAVYQGIWRRFRDEGVEIPYPQRDVHIVPAGGHDVAGGREAE